MKHQNALVPRPPQAQHEKNNGDELEAHTPAHELLGFVGSATAHHIEEAKAEHDENCAHHNGAEAIYKIHWSDILFTNLSIRPWGMMRRARPMRWVGVVT